MKILKHTGNYLESKVKLNRDMSILLLLIGLGGLGYSVLSANYISAKFSLMYLFIICLIVGSFFLKNYTNYKNGLSAEKLVSESLQNLNDDYFIINDIKLRGNQGNIDQIVLGPNGIFVIETKNYSGKIQCNGDEWRRHYEGGLKISMTGRPYWVPDRDYDAGSPSKQVKKGAVNIKQIIESSKISKKPLKIWVEGIVVFTNPHVHLQLSNTTVTILKVDKLCPYIKSKKSGINFSLQELESIGKLILNEQM